MDQEADMTIRISKKQRNKLLYTLGVPYEIGKNMSKFYLSVLELGHAPYDSGLHLGGSIEGIKFIVEDKAKNTPVKPR